MVCFAVLSVVLPCHAHAENWVPTGVEGAEYDKDRVFKTKNPDVFVVWMREHVRKRIRDQRVIAGVYSSEIDCYAKQWHTLGAWWVLEDGRLEKRNLEGTYTGPFGFNEWNGFFGATVCNQSNEFYKKR